MTNFPASDGPTRLRGSRPAARPAPAVDCCRPCPCLAAVAVPWAGYRAGSARDARLHGKSRRLPRTGKTCCRRRRRETDVPGLERTFQVLKEGRIEINLAIVRTVEWPHGGLCEAAARSCYA